MRAGLLAAVITKTRKYKLHYSEVRGNLLWPQNDTNTACSEDK